MFQALLATFLAFASGTKAATLPSERKTYIQNVRIVQVSTSSLSGGTTTENKTYVMDVNAFGLILSTSVAYTNQSNTFTSSQTISDGTGGGLLVRGDSVTASAFFGDASHLTGVTASFSGGNVQNTTTFQSSVTVNDGTSGGLLVRGDSVTASAFFGDGSHLSGVSGGTFNGGAVANATTFFSSVTINDGVTGGLLVSVGNISTPSGGVVSTSGSFTNGITASSGTFKNGDVTIVSGGVVASSGSFANGVTASSATLTAGNLSIAPGFGFVNGSSSMSVTGMMFFISSQTSFSQGASTFSSVGTNTFFSTYTIAANTLSIGDTLVVECLTWNGGTLTSPQEGSFYTSPNIGHESALTTASSFITVHSELTSLDQGSAILHGYGYAMSTTGTGSNPAITSTGNGGTIAFDIRNSQTVKCYGRTSGGGSVNFVYMKVSKK